MAQNPVKIAINSADELQEKLAKMKKQSQTVVDKTMKDFKSRGPGWVGQAVSETYNIKKAEVKKSYKGTTGSTKKNGSNKISKYNSDIGGSNYYTDIGLIYRDTPRTVRTFGMRPQHPPKRTQKKFARIPGQDFATNAEIVMTKPPAPYKVSAEVIRGQRKEIPGTVFIASSNHSGDIPFIRKSDDRNDIKSVKTTNVAQMIRNENVEQDLKEKISDGLGKRLEHHLDRELRKN